MTMESFGSDAGWMARYALSRTGKPVPWALIEANIRSTQPYAVFGLRSMLVVSYLEKALYEMPESELTPARVIALGDEVEAKIQGGLSSRPVLSVPHILADEVRFSVFLRCVARERGWEKEREAPADSFRLFFFFWSRRFFSFFLFSDDDLSLAHPQTTPRLPLHHQTNKKNSRPPTTTATPSRRAPCTKTARPSAPCWGRTTWPTGPRWALYWIMATGRRATRSPSSTWCRS
jgi:hypothetical protein